MRVVDEHVKVLEKILAEHALNIEASGLEILQVVYQYFLVDDGVGAGF